jgi:endonuclease/exonuclease/phosphatase family metal-dependent hydrolase
MTLITLNTWGGRAGFPLLEEFFKKYRDTDVFCLQEIWQAKEMSFLETRDKNIVKDLLFKIAECLPDHRYFFRPQFQGVYGLATFVRKDITVRDEGEIFVFKYQGYENPASMGNHARNIQYLNIETKSGPLTIINFHGLWNGFGKTDSPDRILQSQKIAAFISELENSCVLAGDFNLLPESESLGIIQNKCPQDLIKRYGVTSTRSSMYPKPGKFADYIFASDDIKISEFHVLADEVSDHLGLRMSFEI